MGDDAIYYACASCGTVQPEYRVWQVRNEQTLGPVRVVRITDSEWRGFRRLLRGRDAGYLACPVPGARIVFLWRTYRVPAHGGVRRGGPPRTG